MERQEPNPLVLVGALLGHLIVTGLTWRDLNRRATSEIRGSKTLWRVISGLNTSGSLAYVVVGRRR